MTRLKREKAKAGPQGRRNSGVALRHAGHHQVDGTTGTEASAQAQAVAPPVAWPGIRLRVPLYERDGRKFFRSPETGREIEAGKFTFGYLGQKPENQP